MKTVQETIIILRGDDKASQTLARVGTELKNLGSAAESFKLKLKGVDQYIMGIAQTAALFSLSKVLAGSVKTAGEMERALQGLAIAAQYYGHDQVQAIDAARKATEDGLIDMATAAESFKNLLAKGFTIPEATKIIETSKAMALYFRQGHLTMNQAVKSTTEGIRMELSALTDSAGMTKNLEDIYKDYAQTLGKVQSELSATEKRQAILNYFEEEGAGVLEALRKGTTNYSLELAKLEAQIKRVQTVIGMGLVPELSAAFGWLSEKLPAALFALKRILLEVFLIPVEGLEDIKDGIKSAITDVKAAWLWWKGEREKAYRILEEKEQETTKKTSEKETTRRRLREETFEEWVTRLSGDFGTPKVPNIAPKPEGPELPTPAEMKTKKEWERKLRELRYEAAASGLTDYEKDILRFKARAEELKEEFKGIAGAAEEIDKWLGEVIAGRRWEERVKIEKSMFEEKEKALKAYRDMLKDVRIREEQGTQALIQKEEERMNEYLTILDRVRALGIIGEEAFEEHREAIRKAGNTRIEKIIEEGQRKELEAAARYRLDRLKIMEATYAADKDTILRAKREVYEELDRYYRGLQEKAEDAGDIAGLAEIQERLNEIREELSMLEIEITERAGTALEGLMTGLRKLHYESKSIFEQSRDLVGKVADSMTEAFENFFDITSANFMKFGNFAKAILRSIYLETLKVALIKPFQMLLQEKLFGFLSGIFQPSARINYGGAFHKGGYVVRLHAGGLLADEVPAILQTGEYVVSRRGVKALDKINQGQVMAPNVTINLVNQSPVPITAEYSPRTSTDPEKYIIDVILKDIQVGGKLRYVLSGR